MLLFSSTASWVFLDRRTSQYFVCVRYGLPDTDNHGQVEDQRNDGETHVAHNQGAPNVQTSWHLFVMNI